MIFWDVTPYNLVDTYKWFSGICYPMNGDNRLLRNTNIHSPQHMVSHLTTVNFIQTVARNHNLFHVFLHTAEQNKYWMNYDETN